MSVASIQSKPTMQTLPAPGLLAWLRESGLPLWIHGGSLKYFRAALPVVRCSLDDGEFDRLREMLGPNPTGPAGSDLATTAEIPGLRSAARSTAEIKLLLDLPEWDEEFHCLIGRGHSAEVGHTDGWDCTIDHLILRADWAQLSDAELPAWEVHPDSAAGLIAAGRDALGDLREERLVPARTELPAETLDAATLLRLAVLPAALDFEMDAQLADRIANDFDLEQAQGLSRKQLHRQFKRLMTGAKPSRSFVLMSDAGILEWFLPELQAGRNLAQNRHHKHDIFFHSVYVCDAVVGPNLPLRLAGLIHDLGKVDTRRELPNGEATFHNHEMVSTRHADRILRRFGFPAPLIKHVRFLVRNHMFHYTSEWTDRAVRRFVKRVPPHLLEDMITLRLADRKGSGKKTALPRAIKDLMRHMERVRAEEAELKVRDLELNGHGLMAMGMRPGPEMGNLLEQLLSEVKAGELNNQADELRQRAKTLLNAHRGAAQLQEH